MPNTNSETRYAEEEISKVEDYFQYFKDALDKGTGVDLSRLTEIPTVYHQEIALRIIKIGLGFWVAKNLEKFSNIDTNAIALELVNKMKFDAIFNNLDKFSNLNREVAIALIKKGQGKAVIINKEKFSNILDSEIISEILKTPYEDQENREIIMCALSRLHNFDCEITIELINKGFGSLVAMNLEKFEKFIIELKKQLTEEKYLKYLTKIKSTLRDNINFILDSRDIDYLENETMMLKNVSFTGLNILRQKQELDKYSIKTNEEAQQVYQELKEKVKDWQDSEINKRFEAGGEIFGYHRMFEFAKPGSRHDALYAFDKIIELYQKSGLPPQQFFNNIRTYAVAYI